MHRTEQIVMEFQSPVATIDHGLSCVNGCKGFLPLTVESQMLRGLKRQRPGPASSALSRHRAVRCFSKIAFSAVVDCLAMAAIVSFAALATLLLGL